MSDISITNTLEAEPLGGSEIIVPPLADNCERVKVYALGADGHWHSCGIGQARITQEETPLFMVLFDPLEPNYSEPSFQLEISTSDAYKLEGDENAIIQVERVGNQDIAFSFQNPQCAEACWNSIQKILGELGGGALLAGGVDRLAGEPQSDTLMNPFSMFSEEVFQESFRGDGMLSDTDMELETFFNAHNLSSNVEVVQSASNHPTTTDIMGSLSMPSLDSLPQPYYSHLGDIYRILSNWGALLYGQEGRAGGAYSQFHGMLPLEGGPSSTSESPLALVFLSKEGQLALYRLLYDSLKIIESTREGAHSTDAHYLSGIVWALLGTRSTSLLNNLLQGDLFEALVGALEYDRPRLTQGDASLGVYSSPLLPLEGVLLSTTSGKHARVVDPDPPLRRRWRFRRYLKNRVIFRQVGEGLDDHLRDCIMFTWRLHFLTDIVSPACDEDTITWLASTAYSTQAQVLIEVTKSMDLLPSVCALIRARAGIERDVGAVDEGDSVFFSEVEDGEEDEDGRSPEKGDGREGDEGALETTRTHHHPRKRCKSILSSQAEEETMGRISENPVEGVGTVDGATPHKVGVIASFCEGDATTITNNNTTLTSTNCLFRIAPISKEPYHALAFLYELIKWTRELQPTPRASVIFSLERNSRMPSVYETLRVVIGDVLSSSTEVFQALDIIFFLASVDPVPLREYCMECKLPTPSHPTPQLPTLSTLAPPIRPLERERGGVHNGCAWEHGCVISPASVRTPISSKGLSSPVVVEGGAAQQFPLLLLLIRRSVDDPDPRIQSTSFSILRLLLDLSNTVVMSSLGGVSMGLPAPPFQWFDLMFEHYLPWLYAPFFMPLPPLSTGSSAGDMPNPSDSMKSLDSLLEKLQTVTLPSAVANPKLSLGDKEALMRHFRGSAGELSHDILPHLLPPDSGRGEDSQGKQGGVLDGGDGGHLGTMGEESESSRSSKFAALELLLELLARYPVRASALIKRYHLHIHALRVCTYKEKTMVLEGIKLIKALVQSKDQLIHRSVYLRHTCAQTTICHAPHLNHVHTIPPTHTHARPASSVHATY